MTKTYEVRPREVTFGCFGPFVTLWTDVPFIPATDRR